ncbi:MULTISPECIES: DUF6924 domain-containing protein [unclassified Streptomyces]|uniref:DUF6924 domain-containing protein n=1 Tax=unclassified Streptomyces TaxID=2593676 RepID=UPI0004C2009B|nr:MULTISPECIES: hypothetical protein [unclassified Streptomyces]
MRTLPRTDDDFPAMLVIRTHYGDDEGWQRVREALDEPWVFDEDDEDDEGVKGEILFVEDPAWEDAEPAAVLAALTAPEEGGGEEPVECGWAVVFLADRVGMENARPSLLAVSTDPEEVTAPFRIAARVTSHGMHWNLALANMDFGDFEGWDGELVD